MYYGIASAAILINSAGYRDCVTQSRYYTFKILAPAAARGLCYIVQYYNFAAASILAPRGMCYNATVLQKRARTPGAGREIVLQFRNVTQKEICSKPDPERCRSKLCYKRGEGELLLILALADHIHRKAKDNASDCTKS